MADPRSTLEGILRWHLEAGIDETIGAEPVNRLARADAAAAPLQMPAPEPPAASPVPPTVAPGASEAPAPFTGPTGERGGRARPSPPPGELPPAAEEAVRSAVEEARAAASVDALRAALEAFDGCALKKTATNLVFTDGAHDAELMFVGEGPGAEEDRQGLPFVGPSGKLLDAMMASIGFDRSRALISNTVFWRPPGNRTPTPQETAVCLPFLERLIELVDPKVLVALGAPAAKVLLGQSQGIGRLRGKWFEYATPGLAAPIPATAVFHPAYLLRTPAMKREAWRDLLMIKARLAGE